MICLPEENHCHIREQVKDPIIQCLLAMGCFDWETPNNRLHQTTPAMRFAAALGSHLVDWIIKIKDQVRGFLMFCLTETDEDLLG